VGEEGGTVTIAMPSILSNPWNPLQGSNWIYDQTLQRATRDIGLLTNPYTGLAMPQRIERAEITAREGLPIGVGSDWVTLSFEPEIQVPEDAWADWDAESQTFITAGERFTETATANIKSVVYYPEELWDITWHDGSPLTLADFVLAFILNFDPGKEASPIYDEAQVPAVENFLDTFKGMRIVQEDPLVIEWYTDAFTLDAENNVVTNFPTYTFGPGNVANLAIGMLADENQELAFSADKADALGIEWMSYIAGPSLEILQGYLTQATDESYIPYEPTLGQYITPEEVTQRYQNLQSWYGEKGHFWVGTGPYYLEEAFPVEGTVQLIANPDFPDAAVKWSGFEEPMIATVELEGESRVTIGGEATFEVFVDFGDEPYPADQIGEVKYLIFDATGQLASTGTAEMVSDGLYEVTLSAEETGQLEAGANRIEVAVVPTAVSVPTFATMEFVTVP
jgi:peptide/nickel transport system substrate-binding protein